MSNAKYNWAAHMPRIVKLYMEGQSIPRIHEAIQRESDGFTPSLGMLYAKLRSMGYPTDPTERARMIASLDIARWPSEILLSSIHNVTRRQGPQSHVSQDYARSPNSFEFFSPAQTISDQVGQPESTQRAFGSMLSPWKAGPSTLTQPGLTPIPEDKQTFEKPSSSEATQNMSSWLASNDAPSISMQNESPWEFGAGSSFTDLTDFPIGPFETPSSPQPDFPSSSGKLVSPDAFPETEDPGSDNFDTSQLGSASDDQRSDVCPTVSPSTQPTPPRNLNQPGPPTSSSLGDRFLPSRKSKAWNNRCPTPETRFSAATTDSGYASGRDSPFNQLLKGERYNPRSLDEFKGLYRVPCSRLHQPRSYNDFFMPQPKARFKDTETCRDCQYSGIHNLSWSAKELKLEVFLAELKLDQVYEVTALDAAGSSALHYAAAGGASYDHFSALIKAGVNPYRINTNGQLFLHCLRPKLTHTNTEGSDPHLITAFNLNLVNLLNFFRLTSAFGWRDNEGMTAMDFLALHVGDIHTLSQIFSAVENAGHPLEVSPRFQKSPKGVKSTKSQQSSPSSLPSTPKRELPSLCNIGDHNGQRQLKLRDILRRARVEPSYVDPETGNNALHAISCINTAENVPHMELLSTIRAFACRDGLDLNLQNREQDSPLTAIICRSPGQGMEGHETGATLSKYLDALLWKEPLLRRRNRVNVNMRNRKGATALYYAATRGRPDSVRSLIEAGANVNAKLRIDSQAVSILQATLDAKDRALDETPNDPVQIYLYDNVLSYLEHENAVAAPTLFDERQVSENSVRVMPGYPLEE